MFYKDIEKRWLSLEKYIGRKLNKIVCFDISHINGLYSVASCVACSPKGPLFSDYRFFNIEGITPGDDYMAMDQALSKRFLKVVDLEQVPDIIFIDGGIGQVKYAMNALSKKLIEWNKHVDVIGISKGKERIHGNEKFISGYTFDYLDINKKCDFFYLILQLRDEAHRYSNKKRKDKQEKLELKTSLEKLKGIGKLRAQKINIALNGRSITSLSLEDLEQIDCISKKLALDIYNQLHVKK